MVSRRSSFPPAPCSDCPAALAIAESSPTPRAKTIRRTGAVQRPIVRVPRQPADAVRHHAPARNDRTHAAEHHHEPTDHTAQPDPSSRPESVYLAARVK